MRIFKLSDEIFDDEYEVYRYLNKQLPGQDYCFYEEGEYSKVAEHTVNEGDIILFSFKYNIIGIGILESGRLDSDNSDFYYMYRFRPGTIKTFPLGLNLNDLHSYLTSHGIDVKKPFIPRRDWPLIENIYSPLVVGWIKIQLFKYYDDIGSF